MKDLQIVALSCCMEALSIDSENLFWVKLKTDYANAFPNLIDRTRFNRHRKRLIDIIERVQNSVIFSVHTVALLQQLVWQKNSHKGTGSNKLIRYVLKLFTAKTLLPFCGNRNDPLRSCSQSPVPYKKPERSHLYCR